MSKVNYGPAPIPPKNWDGTINRDDGKIVSVTPFHIHVQMRGMPKGVTRAFSRRLLPKRKAKVGDRFSAFDVNTFLVGANLNGNNVFRRDPVKMGLPLR